MAHNKVYAVCENYCMEETMTKEQIEEELEGKSDTNHNHDDRYFTKTEVNGKFAVITETAQFGSGTTKILNIAFPSGFNKDNCVVIAAYVNCFSVSNGGNNKLVPDDGVVFKIEGSQIRALAYTNDGRSSIDVHIVLMKIS